MIALLCYCQDAETLGANPMQAAGRVPILARLAAYWDKRDEESKQHGAAMPLQGLTATAKVHPRGRCMLHFGQPEEIAALKRTMLCSMHA